MFSGPSSRAFPPLFRHVSRSYPTAPRALRHRLVAALRMMSSSPSTPSSPGGAPQRFCILQTGDSPPAIKPRFGGYDDLFLHWLRDAGKKGDVWDVVRWHEGERVDVESRMAEYDAFLITGSAADAHERLEWIEELEEAVRLLYASRKRILGVCFGHQLISNALGGRSDRSDAGWEIGIRPLQLNDTFVKHFGPVVSQNLTVLQSHRDQVLELPKEGVLLGSSPNCPIEMYQVGAGPDPPILCLQGHPEFSAEYARELIKAKCDLVPAAVRDEAFAKLDDPGQANAVNPDWFKELLRAFLEGRSLHADSKPDSDARG